MSLIFKAGFQVELSTSLPIRIFFHVLLIESNWSTSTFFPEGVLSLSLYLGLLGLLIFLVLLNLIGCISSKSVNSFKGSLSCSSCFYIHPRFSLVRNWFVQNLNLLFCKSIFYCFYWWFIITVICYFKRSILIWKLHILFLKLSLWWQHRLSSWHRRSCRPEVRELRRSFSHLFLQKSKVFRFLIDRRQRFFLIVLCNITIILHRALYISSQIQFLIDSFNIFFMSSISCDGLILLLVPIAFFLFHLFIQFIHIIDIFLYEILPICLIFQ